MMLSEKDFVLELASRQYQVRPAEERLRSGEYATLSGDSCKQIWKIDSIENSDLCLVFQIKETQDPELKDLKKQIIVFDSQRMLKSTWTTEPLLARSVALEPRLFAQYLHQEPVQQNYLSLGEMPVSCLNAVLAIEDRNFLEHSGISYLGIFRAVFRNLTGTRYAQGGSTITQQLVKNYFSEF